MITTDKLNTTDYVQIPSFTTAEIDAKLIANELPAGTLVYNSETNAMQVSTGVGVTPVVYSPVLSHVTAFSASEINNALGSPLVVVPAQGAGKAVSYQGGYAKLTYGSAPFDFSSTAWRIVNAADDSQPIDGTGAGIAFLGGVTSDSLGLYATSAGNGALLQNSLADNQPLLLKAAIADSTGGTGCTIELTVFYTVIDL